jgi:hypothetical protein
MAVNISPVGGAAAQFFDNNGVILSGGKIYTYAAGTTTPQATYTSSSGGTAHTNPIILDSAGRVPNGEIWLTGGASYKFVLKTSADVLIGTYDNIVFAASAANIAYTPGAQSLLTDTTVQSALDSLSNSSTGSSKIGFLQAGTGATATTVQARLRQTVSVKDFGAVGNGTADDTAAIQAALNTGKSVYIPSGTYKCTGTLNLKPQQIVYGDGPSNTALVYSQTTGVLINGDPTSSPSYAADYSNTNYNCNGAILKDMSLTGTWTANSSNTSIGICAQFGGYYDGSLQNLDIRGFNIGVQLAGSVQTMRNCHIAICLYGFKTVTTTTTETYNFSDTFLIETNWADTCGQTITQTPSSQSASGSIVVFNVPNASAFMQWTPITQAATGARGLIQSINTAYSQITCYVYQGTMNNTAIVNHQGACFWLSQYSNNFRFINNEVYGSTNGLVTISSGIASYVDQFWVDIDMSGAAMIETNAGSFVRGPIGITGPNGDLVVADPNLYFGYSSLGQKTATFNDGSISGYGMVTPNNQPFRAIYNGGYKVAIADKIVQVMGDSAGASDGGVSSTVQYSWVLNKDTGNAPVVLSLGYSYAIDTSPYLSAGQLIPLPLSGKLIDFIASGVTSKFQPSVDNLMSLGSATNRWNVVYAATGTINTSDGNQKTEIVDISEVEKRVALKLKNCVKRFKFKDAVELKGSSARYHFGVIAQEVKTAFESEGLNADEYGLFCSNVLDDKTEQLGIRYDELFAFIISSI